MTGSDEHGQKIQRAAEAQGITPLEYTTNIVNGFKALWEKMHISNDDFIRTTDERHEKVVSSVIYKKLMRRAIFTKPNMKAGIVHRTKLFGQSRS